MVRLTDRPNMDIDAYHERKTTTQQHRYLGSVIFAFKTTLTPTLNHITGINTFGEGFKKKTLFAINALFTKDNNLSKTKVGGLCRKQSLHARNVKQT